MPKPEQTYYPVGRALKGLEVLARIPPLANLVVKFRLDDEEIRIAAFVVRVLLEIAELPAATMAEAEAYLGLFDFEEKPTFDALTVEIASVAGDRDGGLYRARQMLAQIEPLSLWAARPHTTAEMITLGARVILKVIELAELSPDQQKAVADYFDLDSAVEIAKAIGNA